LLEIDGFFSSVQVDPCDLFVQLLESLAILNRKAKVVARVTSLFLTKASDLTAASFYLLSEPLCQGQVLLLLGLTRLQLIRQLHVCKVQLRNGLLLLV